MKMSNENNLLRYERAFKAFHGKEAKITTRGGGWYYIKSDAIISGPYRMSKIVEMAENLENRVSV